MRATVFIVVLISSSAVFAQECSFGWFGDRCQYKCHCRNNTKCSKVTGQCTDHEPCERGWFDFKCQYRDLAVDGNVNITNVTQPVTTLTDANDTTCFEAEEKRTVSLTWSTGFLFNRLRLVVGKVVHLTRFNVTLKSNQTQVLSCLQPRFSVVDNLTVDFSCGVLEPVQLIIIEGVGVSSLCSIYVNGGRNVALKEKAEQTSNFSIKYSADKAVDGNSKDIYFTEASCTHTADNDPSPKWTLTFDAEFVVSRFVLFNRGDDCCKDRLRNFRLQTLDNKNNTLFNYSDPRTSAIGIYSFLNNNSTMPVKKLFISPSGNFLTLCEVEIYGDCPPGRWSLECNQTCNGDCPANCHLHSGECVTSCVGFSNPPECNITCNQGYWGRNCLNTCDNCFQEECNYLNGFCSQGCLGYTDPPYCSEGCSWGRYGKNCVNKCSDKCVHNTCDPNTGKCLKCIVGFQGDFCFHECQPGFWGQDCNNSCSVYCYNSSCNNVNGSCNVGCIGAYDPPVCNETCHSGYHGKNCSEHCSSTCVNETCDSITGLCIFVKNNDEISSATIAGIIIPVFTTIIIIILLLVIWKNKQKLLQITQKCGFTIKATELGELEEFEGYNENRNRKSESACANSYENSLEPPISSVIAVEEFNSFMKSHDKDFFIREFLRIPKPDNVTTDIGSSTENKSKNRYQNIKPFDHNRVYLNTNTSLNEGDYINASYISGIDKEEKFIATQGPHKGMVNDFIRMIWESKVEKIIMLTEVVENGKTKCEKYWPDEGKAKFGSIKMSLKATHKFFDYTISIFELSKRGGEFHTVTHFHFTAWPDISIPHSPWSLVEFKHKVSMTPSSNPVVVHCSAGVGRTGTYIAIQNVLKLAENTSQIDVFHVVAKLRQERMFMVQNPTQYEFIYKSVQVALLCSGLTYNACSYIETFKSLELKKSPLLDMLDNTFNGLKMVCTLDTQEDHVYTEYKYEDSDTSSHLKNRFLSIVPNPLFQPVLSKESKDLEHYINAVIIPGFKGKTRHILTQLPMPSTVIDFWRLVIQHRASLLVAFEFNEMLSNQSFGNYLLVEQTFKTLPYDIQPTYQKKTNLWEEQGFTVHIRKTPFKSEHLNVVHLKSLFTDLDATKMVSFMKYLRSQNSLNKPIVFLCRDGAFYSGLACALYLLMDRFDFDCYFTVPAVVGHVKSIRQEVIPDTEQYVFVHKVLQRYIELSSQYNNVGNDILNKSKKACIQEEVKEHERLQDYANVKEN